MKHVLYTLLTMVFLISVSSCRKDLEFSPSTGNLQFSKDTVYLDTVFTNIGSSTYTLKVYNRSNDDISIPTIRLGLGEDSEYRLNVDGIPGKSFQNVEILAKDSMYVFIETTIDINNLPDTNGEFLYIDKIEFDSGMNKQEVDLVTLVKDAIFIYPDRDNTTGIIETLTLNIGGEQVETDIQGRYLMPDELTFTNERPYVVYGYAAVPNSETLTVEAGARVHFHANSGILVTEGASLHVNGAYSLDQDLLENEVVFEGDRLEPAFSDVPGQWGTIWLFEGSANNIINYATIKNAGVGVLSDGNPDESGAKLQISNSQIYNSSNFGILGRNTSITGQNVVINNSGQSSLAGTLGGRYNFTHSTIVNYWRNSFRQFPALLLNNYSETAEATVITDLAEANFNNCIIYGNDNPEFILDEINDNNDPVLFEFKFSNCLIRFSDPNNNFTDDNYDFNNSDLYDGIVFNIDPHFMDTENNKLIIGENSGAINIGSPAFVNGTTQFDILNIDRLSSETLDSGAFQHITF